MGNLTPRLEARGCDDFTAAGEERVPAHLYETQDPSLILECGDVVEIEVENGVIRNEQVRIEITRQPQRACCATKWAANSASIEPTRQIQTLYFVWPPN